MNHARMKRRAQITTSYAMLSQARRLVYDLQDIARAVHDERSEVVLVIAADALKWVGIQDYVKVRKL